MKKYNFDTEEPDHEGNTALHWAICTGSECSASFLISGGANPNVKNSKGDTPLHLSVKTLEDHWSVRNIKLLLLEGADRNIIDGEDATAIAYVEDITNSGLQNDVFRILQPPQKWL